MSRRKAPSINSGSMADIAFLLLIFFLLSTTISADKGLKRHLTMPCPLTENCTQNIEEHNLLRIVTNSKSEIMVNHELITEEELVQTLVDFIDNDAERQCDYCRGEQLENASEHPMKAFISLEVHPKTKYDKYISIQDAISSAYFQLRSEYALKTFNKAANDLTTMEIEKTRKAYPFNLVEATN